MELKDVWEKKVYDSGAILNNFIYETPFGHGLTRASTVVAPEKAGMWLTSDLHGQEPFLWSRITMLSGVLRVQLDHIGLHDHPLYASLSDGSTERHVVMGDETLDAAEYREPVEIFCEMLSRVGEDLRLVDVENQFSVYSTLIERAIPYQKLTPRPANFFGLTDIEQII